MPTVLRSGPYRFYFYSSDGGEPAHIHVARDETIAKFWLEPLRCARNTGFRQAELRLIQSIIEARRSELLDAWYAYFAR
jgi:Domain of unknown function (DUF4160)